MSRLWLRLAAWAVPDRALSWPCLTLGGPVIRVLSVPRLLDHDECERLKAQWLKAYQR